MKKVIFSLAFLSLVGAARVYSVDSMTHDVMQTPVQTESPSMDNKVDPEHVDSMGTSTLQDDSSMKKDASGDMDSTPFVPFEE